MAVARGLVDEAVGWGWAVVAVARARVEQVAAKAREEVAAKAREEVAGRGAARGWGEMAVARGLVDEAVGLGWAVVALARARVVQVAAKAREEVAGRGAARG
ncbi:hypothetical protein ABPG77_006852 [Micractinium sp. CCAP 211/92]